MTPGEAAALGVDKDFEALPWGELVEAATELRAEVRRLRAEIEEMKLQAVADGDGWEPGQ